MGSREYEAFNDDSCDAPLPAASVKDEFSFTRFAPLTIPRTDAQKAAPLREPVTIPRDWVNPWLARRLRLELHRALDDDTVDVIKGGAAFNPDWREWVDPIDPLFDETVDIVYVDPADLDDGIVSFDGEQYEIDLTPENGIELLQTGSTHITGMAVHGGKETDFYLVLDVKAGDIGIGAEPFAMMSYSLDMPAVLTEPAPARKAVPGYRVRKMIDEQVLPASEFVLHLPYRQTWELKGYSRGELLNSITLAPEEKTSIELFTWDKQTRNTEQHSTDEREGTLEATFTDKNTLETFKEATKTNNWEFDASLGASVPIKAVKLDADLDYGASGTTTDINRATTQTISEAVRNAAYRVKQSRQTKVLETESVGRENRVTRTIHNPNTCHTLSLDYFEVLEHYDVKTELDLDRVRLGVTVPNLIADRIDRQFLLNYEGVLQQSLLSESHRPGFDAARKLETRDRLCRLQCMDSCECETPGDGTSSSEMTATDPSPIIEAGRVLQESLHTLTDADYGEFCNLPLINPDQEDWIEQKANYHAWVYWTLVTDANPRLEREASTFLETFDPSGEEEAALTALETFLRSVNRSTLEALFDLATLRIELVLDVLQTTFDAITGCPLYGIPRLALTVGIDDVGLPENVARSRSVLEAYRRPVEPAAEDVGAETLATFEGPSEEFTDMELAEAEVAVRALLSHVRHNQSHYRLAIWNAMTANDRYRLLSLLGNLPDYVEPEAIGAIGDRFVMTYDLEADDYVREWFTKNVLKNPIFTDAEGDVSEITLPTGGVTIASRLGQCDACEEFISEHRELDVAEKAAENRLLRAHARQAEAEARRYDDRLEQEPPLLDGPNQSTEAESAIRVILDHDNAANTEKEEKRAP